MTRIVQATIIVFVVLLTLLISTLWIGPTLLNPLTEAATTGAGDVGTEWYGTFQLIETIMVQWTPLAIGGGILIWLFAQAVFFQGGVFR